MYPNILIKISNMKRLLYFGFLFGWGLFFCNACSKDMGASNNSSGSMYIPTTSDVTSNATLAELQQGRTLYMNNCGTCHALYSPDNYSASSWSNILSNMVPRTGLSSVDATLVLKYVTRGK